MLVNKLLAFEQNRDVNSGISILAIVILGAVNIAVLYVAPVLIGAMVELLGFSEAEAGFIISSELLGMLLATFPALYWVSRVNWRRALLWSLTAMMLINFLSSTVQSYDALLGLRFLFGIAAGSSMAICLAMIGLTADPDRTFGLWVTGQLVLGVVGLFVLPVLLPQLGFGFVYLAMIPITLGLLFLLRYLPQQGREQAAGHQQQPNVTPQQKHILTWAYLGLVAVFIYYVGQFSVWAYFDRIGAGIGLGSEQIGESLALATLLGIGGGVGAAMISARFGRMLPIVLGITASIFSMLLVIGEFNSNQYLIAACIFNFMFNFVLPYLMACIANVDTNGRLMVLTCIPSSSGLAVAPALGAILQQEMGFDAVLYCGIGLTLVCLLLISRLALHKNTLSENNTAAVAVS